MRRQTLAALTLIAIAMLTAAYAQLTIGDMTIKAEKVVSIADVKATVPTESTGVVIFDNVTTLDFTKGGFAAGDKIRVKVELILPDPDVYEVFKSLVVEVYVSDGKPGKVEGKPKATLTINVPYDEFTLTVPSPLAPVKYDLRVVFATGEKAATVNIKLRAIIAGFG